MNPLEGFYNHSWQTSPLHAKYEVLTHICQKWLGGVYHWEDGVKRGQMNLLEGLQNHSWQTSPLHSVIQPFLNMWDIYSYLTFRKIWGVNSYFCLKWLWGACTTEKMVSNVIRWTCWKVFTIIPDKRHPYTQRYSHFSICELFTHIWHFAKYEVLTHICQKWLGGLYHWV